MSARCCRCLLSVNSDKYLCPHCKNDEISAWDKIDSVISKYDKMLFLYSGGKDSIYIYDRIAKKYPHKKFGVVFINNGFSSSHQISRVQELIKKHCPQAENLTDIYDRTEFQEKIKTQIKQALENSFKSSYKTIDFIDGMSIHHYGLQIAKENGYDLLVTGMTALQLKHVRNDSSPLIDGGNVNIYAPLAVLDKSEMEIKYYIKRLGIYDSLDWMETNSQLSMLMAYIDLSIHGKSTFEEEICESIRLGKSCHMSWNNKFEQAYEDFTSGKMEDRITPVLKKLDIDKSKFNAWLREGSSL